MTTRLLQGGDGPRIVPPADRREREAFWIEHGNSLLAAAGMHNLHWRCENGNYFIEKRGA